MKIRSTKVDAGDFKHELLNRLRSTMAVNVLRGEIRHKLEVLKMKFSGNVLAQQSLGEHFKYINCTLCNKQLLRTA